MNRFDLALLAANAAGAAILTVSPTDNVEEKEGHLNFVTMGDKKSEEVLLSFIQKEFPDDLILSEETDSSLNHDQLLAAEHLWILDPIDGTSNYRYGRKYSCIAVGYAEKGVMKFGVAFDPFRNELFTAQHGKGATRNGQAIHVSTETSLEHATIFVSNSYNPATSRKHLEMVLKIPQTPWVQIKGSAVLENCEVAAGQANIYFSTALKPWDTAVPLCIIHEAGGVVLDLEGQPITFLSKTVIAGNEAIVRDFIRVITG